MPIDVQWDNDEHTVIRYDISGKWTWDEFYTAFDESRRLSDTVLYQTVHVLINPTDGVSARHVPPNALTHLMNVFRRSAPNTGVMVRIQGSSLMKALVGLAAKISPQIAAQIRHADSLEDARRLLAELERG